MPGAIEARQYGVDQSFDPNQLIQTYQSTRSMVASLDGAIPQYISYSVDSQLQDKLHREEIKDKEQSFLIDCYMDVVEVLGRTPENTTSDKEKAIEKWIQNRRLPTHEEYPQYWMLNGTGWNMTSSLANFMWNKLMPTEDMDPDALSIEQTATDAKFNNIEYLYQRSFIPNPLELRHEKGETFVYSPLFKSKWVNNISERERNGSMRQNAENVEEFFTWAPEGSTVLVGSPPGPSGFIRSDNGEEAILPDTQFYVFTKRSQGKIDGFTLRLDAMPLSHIEEVFAQLGQPVEEEVKQLPQKERAEMIVRNVLYRRGDENPLEIGDIVDVVRGVKGESAYKNIRFEDEIVRDIAPERTAQLLNYNAMEERIIGKMREHLTTLVWQEGVTQDSLPLLAEQIGKAILEMNMQINGGRINTMEGGHNGAVHKNQHDRIYDAWEYERALRDFKKIQGCNGGGKTSLMPSMDYVGFRFASEGWEQTICPKCNKLTMVRCGYCDECAEAEFGYSEE